MKPWNDVLVKLCQERLITQDEITQNENGCAMRTNCNTEMYINRTKQICKSESQTFYNAIHGVFYVNPCVSRETWFSIYLI